MGKSTITLPSDTEIVMERTFKGSAQNIFRAYTDPELVTKWWGGNGSTIIVDKLEAQPGGAWRFVEKGADGQENAFRGEYKELQEPNLITYTFEWEGLPGHILAETIRLEEQNGETKLISTSVFDTKEDRDGMLASGMQEGADISHDRLDALLVSL